MDQRSRYDEGRFYGLHNPVDDDVFVQHRGFGLEVSVDPYVTLDGYKTE